MKVPPVIGMDFETKGIEDRPLYPPVPVGVSIQMPGEKKPHYYAWGHKPGGNNCSLKDAIRAVKDVWSSKLPVLGHNMKFDIDVAETHMGCKPLPWERIHDTLFLLFFDNPHAMSLSLKPSAERILGMKPEEQDVVREWLIAHGVVKKNQGDWGAYIWEAPGDVVGPYANGDVARTIKLFNKTYPRIMRTGMGAAYDRERQLLPILLENERQGLRVDLAALERDVQLYNKEREKAEAWLRKKLGVKEINFDADAEVAHALNDAGIVTDWTMTKTGRMSVSKKTMTIDKFNDPKVFTVLGYRNKLTTCLSMFMEPWLLKGSANKGHINPNWNQVRQSRSATSNVGTRTGRPSCSNPNLLNLSKSFEDRGDGYTHPKFMKDLSPLPLVRRYMLPDKGNAWMHRDYNQQELRILAHFEDGPIMEAYKADPRMDIHTFVQDEIERITGRRLDRLSVKMLNFGRLYGEGTGGLAERLRVSYGEIKEIRDSQDRALPSLPQMDKAIKDLSRSGEPIKTWGGRLYYVEPPQFVKKYGREMSFEYKLLNYLIQGSAADATKEAIIRYNSVKKDGRFLVTVYDEINICAPKKVVKSEMKILRDIMEGLEFDVPLLTDGKVGPSWGQLEKYKE